MKKSGRRPLKPMFSTQILKRSK
ncbi:hypothetical protein NC653_031410 [Populus alba x Populus x berolinensis]|uniref:Uncharacterized protein n=1 Tax=Populus alba x Populus x berolinensis TaxID=444605 RepID=A0AAD6Q1K1_9ROSI|nr:hypothetical protein NC653_031410 [Populus alba x Populus x berolinensis]